MGKFNNLTIKAKINIFLLVLVVASAAILYLSIRGNDHLIEVSDNKMMNVLDSTERVKLKTLTNAIAHDLSKQLLADTIKSDSSVYAILNNKLGDLRYGKRNEGYFYVYDKQRCIFSLNKIYEGKMLNNNREYVLAQSGGGFMYDNIMHQDKGREIKSLLYSYMIPGTKYWMGTGTYIDSFEEIQGEIIDELDGELAGTIMEMLILFMVSFAVILISIFSIRKSIISPIRDVVKVTQELSTGKIQRFEYTKKDEIKPIFDAINGVMKSLKNTVNFSVDIKNGKFDSEYTLISENDKLGQSLIDMRDSLKEAKVNEDIRKVDEANRSWVMNGHSNIADILRRYQSDIDTLCTKVLQELVNYSEFNQGGVFLVDKENEKRLNLRASYAYDREKFLKKNVDVGEGLVGTCAIEKQTLYMTDIPDNYISITSGLGGANPTNLIICPMIVDDILIGVIELASFTNIEKYKKEFIEKSADNIAATIMTARVSLQTAELLQLSKEQSEHLASQEEELRQNMEEMVATNESRAQNEYEMEKRVELLESELVKLGVDLSKLK